FWILSATLPPQVAAHRVSKRQVDRQEMRSPGNPEGLHQSVLRKRLPDCVTSKTRVPTIYPFPPVVIRAITARRIGSGSVCQDARRIAKLGSVGECAAFCAASLEKCGFSWGFCGSSIPIHSRLPCFAALRPAFLAFQKTRPCRPRLSAG